MKKGDCNECGKPLFDQKNKEDTELQLCDECVEQLKMEHGIDKDY